VALISVMGAVLRNDAQSLLAGIADKLVSKHSPLIYSGSAIRGGVLVRVAGERPEEVARYVYQALGFVSPLLHDDPWIRKLQTLENTN
jgi:hypothetical protein